MRHIHSSGGRQYSHRRDTEEPGRMDAFPRQTGSASTNTLEPTVSVIPLAGRSMCSSDKENGLPRPMRLRGCHHGDSTQHLSRLFALASDPLGRRIDQSVGGLFPLPVLRPRVERAQGPRRTCPRRNEARAPSRLRLPLPLPPHARGVDRRYGTGSFCCSSRLTLSLPRTLLSRHLRAGLTRFR
jgi:hypothetical protein